MTSLANSSALPLHAPRASDARPISQLVILVRALARQAAAEAFRAAQSQTITPTENL
jgi:hypothetical protein